MDEEALLLSDRTDIDGEGPAPFERTRCSALRKKGMMTSRLMSLHYDDLTTMAARLLSRESRSHSFEPTDLVHESYLKLARQSRAAWQNGPHFLAVSARTMRRVLVDHARTKYRVKRGGRGRTRVELRDYHAVSFHGPDQKVMVEDLKAKLAAQNPVRARILELRVTAGFAIEEIARVMGVSSRTIERHWVAIRGWILREQAASPRL